MSRSRRINVGWKQHNTFWGKFCMMAVQCCMILCLFTACGGTKNTADDVDTGTNATQKEEAVRLEPKVVKEVEEDGQIYRIETYEKLTAKYPVNNMKVVSREKIGRGQSTGDRAGNEISKNKSYIIEWQSVPLMPLYDENIVSKITFTLQNCVGTFSRDSSYNLGKYYNVDKVIESVPVTWSGDEIKQELGSGEFETANYYVGIEFRGKEYAKTSELIQMYKKMIDDAIIKVDLIYKDGTVETQYIQMETVSPYNLGTVDYYRLTME